MDVKYVSYSILITILLLITSCSSIENKNIAITNSELQPTNITTPPPNLSTIQLTLNKNELLSGVLIIGPTYNGKIITIDLETETLSLIDIPSKCSELLEGTEILCKDTEGFFIYNWENLSFYRLPQIPENVAFYSEFNYDNIFITSSGNGIYYYINKTGNIELYAIIPPETTPTLITNKLPDSFIAYESLSNDFKYIAGLNKTQTGYVYQIVDVLNDDEILVTDEYEHSSEQSFQWAPKKNIVIYFLDETTFADSLPCPTSFLIYDVATGNLKYISHPDKFTCYNMVFGIPIIWTANGSRIAVTDWDAEWLCIIDPTTGQQSCYPNELAFQKTWSPNGQYIASIDESNSLVVFSVNAGKYTIVADLSEFYLYGVPIRWIDTSE